jgi:hypothetical protein
MSRNPLLAGHQTTKAVVISGFLKLNRIVKEQSNTKILTHVSIKIKGFEDLFKFVDPPVFLRYLGSTIFSPGKQHDIDPLVEIYR